MGIFKTYDDIIKKAYDKGVIVVIAAGNGDLLSNQKSGVNLNVNKMSPVCNYGDNYKRIIGVSAFNKEGYRTDWTNYGVCSPFYGFGIDIYSTGIPVYLDGESEYGIMDGTSFASPQIAGIIGLGFNKYGKISPDIVYDALLESTTKNSVGNTQIDAVKYLDNLGKKYQEQVLKNKAELIFNGLQKKLNKYSEVKRIKTYNSLFSQLSKVQGKVKGDKGIIIDYLCTMIDKELGNK